MDSNYYTSVKSLGDHWTEIEDVTHVIMSGKEIVVVALVRQDCYAEGDNEDCSDHIYQPPRQEIVLRANISKVKEPLEPYDDDEYC